MKLCVISFTEKGEKLSRVIAEKAADMKTELFTKREANADEEKQETPSVAFVETSIIEWAGEQMEQKNALLFIGACGIAVRAAAPHIADKLHDSPVLVMDEEGRFVIPLLSGHVGGANEIAVYLAGQTGAEPVITTATDINRKFAVDLFAKKNGFFIVNKEGIAKVSAKALAGKQITMSIENEYEADGEKKCSQKEKFCQEKKSSQEKSSGQKEKDSRKKESNREKKSVSLRKNICRQEVPPEIFIVPYPPAGPVDVLITTEKCTAAATLLLRPKEYVIGIGCKKGKSIEEIESLILKKIKELGISKTQIFALASICQKQEEPGILAWCRKERIPFFTYTAEELREVEGSFKGSSFVEDKVGVDNVCERAAVKACGTGGRLISEKEAEAGMTIAVAKRRWRVEFYET
ncbi:MAG: cobalamin biosynthesis protein [Clostridium sp.]|nr:cobalamin biosynthesis protein [Clostridium sp.]